MGFKVIKEVFVFGVSVYLAACASSNKKEPRVHPAAMDSDYYFIDNGMPVREVKEDQEFFFKKCNVDNSGPYSTKTNYDCNEL